jgi:RimJ/RimL family protein N-acetyltransferase
METKDLLDPVEIVAGRYQLRPPSLRDAEDLLALALDPETRLWGPIGTVTDLEGARAWCRKWSDWNGGSAAEFGIYDATEGRYLGRVSLHHLDFANQSAEIGYHTAPWARGNGIASAAVRSAVQWGFGALDLVRIQLFHASDNAASCRVAERLGFVLEGETRSSYRYGDGKLHNEHLHGRLATD